MPVALQLGVRLCPPPLFHAGVFSWLELLQFCVCCYNRHEFICASSNLCLENSFLKVIHHLWLSQSFCPLFCTDPWVFVCACDWTLQSPLFSTCWPVVCLCVNCHLEEKLWWGFSDVLTYGSGNTLLAVILLLWLFSSIDSSRLPPRAYDNIYSRFLVSLTVSNMDPISWSRP